MKLPASIFYIANTRIPSEKAHGYQIAKMCEAFADQGVPVELILPYRKNEIFESLFGFYGLKNNFIVRQIGFFDFLKNGRVLQSVIYHIQTFIFLVRLFFLYVPKGTLVYTRNPEIAFVMSLRRKETVFEDHGWPQHRQRIYLFLLNGIKKIVTITQGIQHLYIGETGNTKNIFVAPDAVDLSMFASVSPDRQIYNLPSDKKVIMYTGSFNFYNWKGVDVLAEAGAFLSPECLIVMVGAMKEEIEPFKKLYNNPHIIVIEKKSHKEIPKLLACADVLVLPNKSGNIISEKYTSPLKLFEYMASGVPIVASKLPSIEEILNETNSYLVAPNDPKKLAEAIMYVLAHPEMSQSIACEAKKNVEQHTWQSRADRILQFIYA